MDDSVERYCAASEANDIDAMMAALAPDAALSSPLSGHMTFRGHDDLRILLTAVYGSLTELRWSQPIGDGATRVAIGDCRVAGARLRDAMEFELNDNGLIGMIRPHLRPWFATTVFALKLGPKVAQHPSVVRRALSRR
jgi:hypothetical protein